MPGTREGTVFEAHWYDQLATLDDSVAMGSDYWQQVMAIKIAVNKELEVARVSGQIGSSLDAEVVLYCNDKNMEVLGALGDELRFVLISSKADIVIDDDSAEASTTEIAGLRVKVLVSTEEKCARCWHRRIDVGINPEHQELCGRCLDNITGSGEQRLYA
jgi:isoleucyl-tRNA synthetase